MFVADGVFALINKDIVYEDISPLKIMRRALGVSHLLFADDTLLFFKACGQQASYIRDVLEVYGQATRQLLNLSKCPLLFGSSCFDVNTDAVKNVLQATSSGFEEQYLGLPTPDGKMSKGKVQNLQVKLTKCLFSFDGHPKQAGKEVLIKSVAPSIYTHIHYECVQNSFGGV